MNNILNVGDFVSRKSHNNDTVFKIIKIENDIAYLKGASVRLYADSFITDLDIEENYVDDFNTDLYINDDRGEFFYLPGKILHIDAVFFDN